MFQLQCLSVRVQGSMNRAAEICIRIPLLSMHHAHNNIIIICGVLYLVPVPNAVSILSWETVFTFA